MYENIDLQDILMEARYEMAFSEGTNKAIIELLDLWLSEWLHCKDRCPNCGEESCF